MQDVLAAIRQEWLLERYKWIPLLYPAASSHNTLYIGGGTPSICPVKDLQYLVTELINDIVAHSGKAPAECTLEANPGDLSVSYCKDLIDMGINRLSIGIQSFIDKHLLHMERRHTAAEGKEAFHAAREAGFDNISIDLIFGFPGLTQQEWEETLLQAVALQPDHIAAYQLSLEPDTPWERAKRCLHRKHAYSNILYCKKYWKRTGTYNTKCPPSVCPVKKPFTTVPTGHAYLM